MVAAGLSLQNAVGSETPPDVAASAQLEEGNITSKFEQQHDKVARFRRLRWQQHDKVARFRRLRWQNCMACVFLFAVVAACFGSSPLADLMNTATPASLKWISPGVWYFGLQQLLAQGVIMPLSGGIVKRLTSLQIWMVVSSGMLGPLCIAIAAGTNQLWLEYFGAAIGSFGFATALECDKVVAIQWWSVDGAQAFGAAFQGGAAVVLVLLFSVLLGVVGNVWGLAAAALAEVLLLAVLGLFPLWLALQGELGPPPPDLVDAMANLQSKALQPGSEDSKKHPVKVQISNRCSLYRSVEFWQIAAFNFLVPFCGFGMKLLLTSLFQVTYRTSFLHSSFFATGSLIFFAVARICMPLISRMVPLFSLIIATLCLTGILYASYPAVIAHLPVWWFLAAKSIAGACFAGLNALMPLLNLEVYSASDLPVVFAATGPARALGWGLGPVVGYYIHLASSDSGIELRQSYNLFFYICAALTFIAAVNVVLLRASLLQRRAKAASEPC